MMPVFDDVFVGQELPPLVIPLTPTRIAAGAIATGDFEPIHHDRGAAERTGRPDVFMNILMVNGLLQRCVTDWAGPKARISKIKLRLGAPSVAGDRLTITGAVTEKGGGADGRGEVTVELRGTNRYGEAVRASVVFWLTR
jgi:acyl dehydratase